MSGFLILRLQAVAVNFLVIVVIDVPARGFDAWVGGLVDVDFNVPIDERDLKVGPFRYSLPGQAY